MDSRQRIEGWRKTMYKNNIIIAITVGLMSAVLSSHAIAKNSTSRPSPGQLAFEHCLLDGGETAQNKDVVACCSNGKCTICGKTTAKCVTVDQGRSRAMDMIQRSGRIRLPNNYSTGTMAPQKSTPRPGVTKHPSHYSSTQRSVDQDHRIPTTRHAQ